MMVARMVMQKPLRAKSGQDALADLIADHVAVRAVPDAKSVAGKPANDAKARKAVRYGSWPPGGRRRSDSRKEMSRSRAARGAGRAASH